MSDFHCLDNIFLQSIIGEDSGSFEQSMNQEEPPKRRSKRIRNFLLGEGAKNEEEGIKNEEEEGIKTVREQSFQTAMKVEDEVLQVCRLTFNAIVPTKSTINAAGYDLYSAHTQIIPARGQAAVSTDLQVRVPRGTYGRIGI